MPPSLAGGAPRRLHAVVATDTAVRVRLRAAAPCTARSLYRDAPPDLAPRPAHSPTGGTFPPARRESPCAQVRPRAGPISSRSQDAFVTMLLSAADRLTRSRRLDAHGLGAWLAATASASRSASQQRRPFVTRSAGDSSSRIIDRGVGVAARWRDHGLCRASAAGAGRRAGWLALPTAGNGRRCCSACVSRGSTSCPHPEHRLCRRARSARCGRSSSSSAEAVAREPVRSRYRCAPTELANPRAIPTSHAANCGGTSTDTLRALDYCRRIRGTLPAATCAPGLRSSGRTAGKDWPSNCPRRPPPRSAVGMLLHVDMATMARSLRIPLLVLLS